MGLYESGTNKTNYVTTLGKTLKYDLECYKKLGQTSSLEHTSLST